MNLMKLAKAAAKIGDSADLGKVRTKMFDDLEKRLDNGEIIAAYGADRPGDHVIYCTDKTYEEAAKSFISEFLDSDEWDVARLTKESGINPKDKYIKISKDWNDTGDFNSASRDDVVGLYPEMNSTAKLNALLVDKGIITMDQVEFEDDNNEFVENLSYEDKIPEEVYDELYTSSNHVTDSSWVDDFKEASKGMPYEVVEDDGLIYAKVSGYVNELPSDANKWMKEAYEADSKRDELNEDRYNPSWDVAEEALSEVCESLGLECEEVGDETDAEWWSITEG